VDSTAVIALAGIFAASIVGPALISVLTARQRRAERLEDYARQDAVAAQAAQAAELLLAANERVATQTAEASARTDGKLRQIHELVNSTLTGAMQSQLVAMEAQLAMVRRWEPHEEAHIAALEAAVGGLRAKLDDRSRQTTIADAQLRDRP
jgi:hypothetical protein